MNEYDDKSLDEIMDGFEGPKENSILRSLIEIETMKELSSNLRQIEESCNISYPSDAENIQNLIGYREMARHLRCAIYCSINDILDAKINFEEYRN